jgi:hypothetical protein
MKKTSINIINVIAAVCLVGVAFMQSSCKKDDNNVGSGTPVITKVRSYAATPGDSVLKEANPGNYVVLQGSHFKGIKAVYFDGIEANLNNALGSDNTIPVIVPTIPFATLDQTKLNTITVVTATGQVTYKFPVVPLATIITSMSNEDALAGESVTVNGSNFFYIDKVILPGGVTVSSGIVTNSLGTTLTFTVPTGVTTGGPIQVVNRYGTGTSVLLFDDFTTGVANNFDNVNNYSWGLSSGPSNSSTGFPNNTGYYGVMSATSIPAGDWSWYNGGRSINLNAVQLVPAADVASGNLSNYAVKFEINVPASTPWVNGSIFLSINYGFTYLAAYDPWKNSDGTTSPFITNGWRTVVIPLSQFRTNDGAGNPDTSISDLIGASGNNALSFFFVNDGTTVVTAFTVAIDNIRVEKI